ncbi:teneurin-a [Trichonephila clavipes]|nr:teneurin-a [Trichonephila clavipes]
MLPVLGKKAVLEWCMCVCERFDWIVVCMSKMWKKYGIERKNGSAKEQKVQDIDCMDSSCSGHGACVQGECWCKIGWRGTNCSEADGRLSRCFPDCSSHGVFDLDTEQCICFDHWTGADCSKEAVARVATIVGDPAATRLGIDSNRLWMCSWGTADQAASTSIGERSEEQADQGSNSIW